MHALSRVKDHIMIESYYNINLQVKLVSFFYFTTCARLKLKAINKKRRIISNIYDRVFSQKRFHHTEAATRGVPLKKDFLQILQYSWGNACVGVSF